VAVGNPGPTISWCFQQAWWDTAEPGRQLYTRKWGTRRGDLVSQAKGLRNIWGNAKDDIG
jgi:hypothetical protein